MVNHVKRKANSVAHNLGKKNALFSLPERFRMEDSPSCIADIVTLEQFALLFQSF